MSDLCERFIKYRRLHPRTGINGNPQKALNGTFKGTVKGSQKGTDKGIESAPLVYALTGAQTRDAALIATWNPQFGTKHIPQSVFLDVYMSDSDEVILRAKRRARFGSRASGTHPPPKTDRFLWKTFWKAFHNAQAAFKKA